MPTKPGSHVAYARNSDLVVEWYDFSEHAPHKSANLLIFGRPAQQLLALAIGLAECPSPHNLACEVARAFRSYFAVKSFATKRGIAFATEVDFQP
ncbi:MAG TPA: hypothetical protein VFE10_16050 [Phenylobacterium sp.]|jgi:hypothetical protein|nr:hypothetical protein [Phenylobacterium sp.]